MTEFTSDVPTASVTDLSKRVRYTTGLVLGVDEFVQDQAYLSERDRLLTRALHGYGVVQGLHVHVDTSEDLPQVQVEPGLAVDPCGQHVCVDQAQCAIVDDWLSRKAASDLIGEASEPVRICLSVVLRYGTCATDFVPIPGEPCRSAEEAQVASRLADDFSLSLELEAEAPPHVEEFAIRLLGRLLRSVEVESGESYVTVDDLERLVRALPKVETSDEGTLEGLAAATETEDTPAVSLPTTSEGRPVLRVEPGTEAAALRTLVSTWVTHTRREVLQTGSTDDPLSTGGCGDQSCQPVPEEDDGVILGTLCFEIESDGDGGVERTTSDEDLRVAVDDRPEILASRVLQEAILGASADGSTDGSAEEAAGGDLSGTYPDPEVVGLEGVPVSMEPEDSSLSLSDGHVLTYDGSTWRPEPRPEGDAVPSNAETDLTRIVALSWEHEALYSDPLDLELELEGYAGDLTQGFALAFGSEAVPPSPNSTLSTPEDGVLATTLTVETVRLYLQWANPEIDGLVRRQRLIPGDVVPLEEVRIDGSQRVAGGLVDTDGGLVRGVAYLFPEMDLDFATSEALTLDIDVRGDFILDDREKALDAEFVRGELPTGDRAGTGRAGESGVQGGRFESWVYLRALPEYVDRESTEDGNGDSPPSEVETVDLNEADLEELVTLPAVGDTIAQRILDYRAELEADGEEITDPFQLTVVAGLTENQIREWEGLVEPPLESQ